MLIKASQKHHCLAEQNPINSSLINMIDVLAVLSNNVILLTHKNVDFI